MHFIVDDHLMRMYKLIDQRNGLFKAIQCPPLTRISQLPPGSIVICFGIDKVKYILNHLPLVIDRIQIFE
jgi:hypothetical protein